MHEPTNPINPDPASHQGGGMRTLLMTAGFLLIAAFFLLSEHRAHLLGYLPFLLLLACPFMHIFGHGKHGGHGGHGAPREQPAAQPAAAMKELRHEH